MHRASLCALLVVGLAATVCADYLDETPDRAQVIVAKSVVEDKLTVGENLTIHIDLFNVGGSSALDITIADAGWLPENFEVIEGKTSGKVDKLGVGANYTFSFTLIPKASGPILPLPATVTYRPKAESEETKTAISSDPEPAYVMSKYEKFKMVALKGGSYLTMGMLKTQGEWQAFFTFAAIVTIIIVGNQMILKAKDWHKQRVHNLALEALKSELKDE